MAFFPERLNIINQVQYAAVLWLRSLNKVRESLTVVLGGRPMCLLHYIKPAPLNAVYSVFNY